MVFSSVAFVFLFLPAFVSFYYLSPLRLRNGVALAASLVFYAWGAPRLVFYLIGACGIDYGASRVLSRAGESSGARRAVATIAIALNLALLVYFKYANFFVQELSRVLELLGAGPIPWNDVALPIGISFFTFHRVSYLVDVYRKVTPPARSYGDYLLYVVLFPQLIAGPIVRYHEVESDIAHRRHSLESFFGAMPRFAQGLAKKVLLANVLGEVADRVFGLAPLSLPASHAWIGLVCYAFQIYFDFSGYSDMAIGLAGMIGIRFPENFNHPYISRSITEFWHRWHITLSTFMRDYLYIPLGGNRRGPVRTFLNLWTVFILSGLWHGASWNFVLWGAYHGFFLVTDKLWWLGRVEKLPKALGIAATFLIVLFGWLLFRAPDLPFAVCFAGRMLGLADRVPGEFPIPGSLLIGARARLTLGIAALLSFVPVSESLRSLRDWWTTGTSPETRAALGFSGVLALCFLSLSYLSNSAFNPFIYFRF